MKAKWYLSTFIVILTLLGLSQQQFSVPNQEIVVQFTNNKIALLETQNTIAIVKEQLHSIGVENIQIHKEANGKLKITYFSAIDVASIKKILSKEKDLKLSYSSIFQEEGDSKFPSNRDSNHFKLDVFEIQKSNDGEGDFNGYALELKPESDRFFTSVVYLPFTDIDVKEKNRAEKVAYTIHKKIAIAIDNSSHNIPEVRAGPHTA